MPQSERFAFVNAVRTELRVAGVTIKREQTLVTERDVHNFLACDDPWLPKGKLSFRWPAWSPDGSTIAFRVWGESEEPWPRYFPGMLFTIGADGTNLQRWPDTDSPNTGLQVWSPRGDRLAYIYWMAGDGRYYPDPATPSPDRRFTYKKCCSGLITVDLKKGNWWDEPGPLSTDLQPFGSWSSDGKWLVTRANYPQTGLVVFSVENPERRWTFSDLDVDEVQWQPMSR
jgi:Tol biopolymer transport system component